MYERAYVAAKGFREAVDTSTFARNFSAPVAPRYVVRGAAPRPSREAISSSRIGY
jgi:hypothetical protein